jgi:antitoxin component YwqK of YwqJK toxin-antitoxin module
VEYVNAENIRLQYTITADGKTHGLMHGYYPSGRKHSVANYLYGELHGPFQRFEDSNANILIEHLFYSANQRHGCAQLYFTGQQQIILQKIFHYKYGQLEGLGYEYNMHGIIVREYNYKGGALHGLYKEFDDAGVCKRESLFASGKLQKTFAT